jgi:hypothetical protein
MSTSVERKAEISVDDGSPASFAFELSEKERWEQKPPLDSEEWEKTSSLQRHRLLLFLLFSASPCIYVPLRPFVSSPLIPTLHRLLRRFLRLEALCVTPERGRNRVIVLLIGVVPQDLNMASRAGGEEAVEGRGGSVNGAPVVAKEGREVKGTRGTDDIDDFKQGRDMEWSDALHVTVPDPKPEVLCAGIWEEHSVFKVQLIDGEYSRDWKAKGRGGEVARVLEV